MSQAASQAVKFYKEVAVSERVWTMKDLGGFPAPENSTGKRAMPFWSSCSRVKKIIKFVPAYSGFQPVELNWLEFEQYWIPGLIKDDLLVGINWSGSRAIGYDITPEQLLKNIMYYKKDLL